MPVTLVPTDVGGDRREAEAANRAKDEFLAVVSHELRTPLSVILNSTHLLQAGIPAEKQATVVRRIETNAQLQLKIVTDLLDVSRIIAGKLKIDCAPVKVSALVQRAIEDAMPAALAKGVALSELATTSETQVRGDAARIVQMVGNLLSNAVKFTPPGKSVEVRIHDQPEHVDVGVRDEGVGISPAFLPQLFRRFSQADATTTRKHSGLGLGLSIVRELVELHGGTAFANSDGPGLGATFTIRLPKLADQSTVLTPPAQKPIDDGAPPVSLTGLRVLVVDDEHDVRATLADMLLSCGAAVTTAGSVREALHVFRLGGIDVVVSDIAMPEQDGYELLARIRALPGPAGCTPVLALTAYASLSDRERAIAAGFDRYLSKPATVRQLSHAIAELCRNSLLSTG